jgi:AraC family transcriptional regulator
MLNTISPEAIESQWGVSAKAKGGGSLGLQAALWDLGYIEAKEVVRRPCDQTHVVSIWTQGSTRSDLYIDDTLRYSKVRARGTFQLARAGEALRAVLNKRSGTCLDIYLPADILNQCLENEYEGARGSLELRPLGLENDAVITRLGDQIASEIQELNMASRMAIDSATLLLAVTLIRRWSNQTAPVRQPTGGLAPWQARRTTEYMREHLAKEISLTELAGLAKLSPFHFARAFKQTVGKPPHAYQCSLRVARAKELLDATDIPVIEVAAMVGYESPQALARMFKRELGVSPTQYRRGRRS